MPPPPPPSNFFSSLKQVEKRLKSEHQSPQQKQSSFPEKTNPLSEQDSLSSPMYLHSEETSTTSTLQETSEAPHVFLSYSPQFPTTLQNPPQNHHKSINHVHNDNDPVDDIQKLIQILGLEDGKTKVGRDVVDLEVNSCHCESEFYKIVGVKGHKCGKEVERLDGWINYYFNGGDEEERLEPLRLAYLLLGKAAFASEGSRGCFEGLELQFPSTIDDFLLNDPPTY